MTGFRVSAFGKKGDCPLNSGGQSPFFPNALSCSRRTVLRSLVGGSLLLPGILAQLLAAEERRQTNDPLAAKKPHFEPKAKRVIFLFSTGGVSHMDTFDYKPKLFAADGKTLGVGGGLSLEQRPLLKPRWDF